MHATVDWRESPMSDKIKKLVAMALDSAAQVAADRELGQRVIDHFAPDGTAEGELMEYLGRLAAIHRTYSE